MPGEKPDQLAKRLIASGQGFGPAPRDGDASPPASRDGELREPSSPRERWSPRALSPPPVASPEQLAELREELGAAQTAFAEETNRLDALQEGLERAADERRTAQRAVDAAEESARNARLSNKTDLVYAYLNNE